MKVVDVVKVANYLSTGMMNPIERGICWYEIKESEWLLREDPEDKVLEKQADDWFLFCSDRTSMQVAQVFLENISPYQF